MSRLGSTDDGQSEKNEVCFLLLDFTTGIPAYRYHRTTLSAASARHCYLKMSENPVSLGPMPLHQTRVILPGAECSIFLD